VGKIWFLRYLLQKPSCSPFYLKFPCHSNGDRLRKMWIAAFDGSTPNPLPFNAKILQTSYRSRAIAHFVLNVVPWQRGLGGVKCGLHRSTAQPLKPSYRRKKFADISYRSRVITHFVPNFVAMATRVS